MSPRVSVDVEQETEILTSHCSSLRQLRRAGADRTWSTQRSKEERSQSDAPLPFSGRGRSSAGKDVTRAPSSSIQRKTESDLGNTELCQTLQLPAGGFP